MTAGNRSPGRTVSPAQLRAMVAAWVGRDEPGRAAPALALRARPEWAGEPAFELDRTRVRVVPAVSALAVRAALLDRAEGERLVVLTECDEADLGTGLLTYFSGNRVVSVEPWEIVRTHFRASGLDPALVRLGRRVAEALLEHAPPGGWPPAPDGLLTRDRALRGLTARLLDVDPGDLDATGVLQWTTRGADVVRYAALPADLRRCLTGWLGEVAGRVARMAMACVDSGNGTDAIPLGVVAGLLWTDPLPSAGDAAARARLETFLGGLAPTGADARAWSEAALSWVERVLDGADRPEAQRALGRAELLAADVRAEAFVVRSDLLPAALDARLAEFAGAVRAALARPAAATLADTEEALRRAGRHRLAGVDSRFPVAEAALRALRWLSTPDTAPGTLAEAVARQVAEDGWVERARLRLWVGVSDPATAQAYRRLHEAVEARRARHDEQFARLFAAATAADADPGAMLRVEDVMARVVRPILDAGRLLLFVVVDGMGAAASTTLVESVTAGTWWELTPAGGPRVGVLAALPTVTEVCRASLLSGRLARGGQPEERTGLAAAFGPDTALFHKAELVFGAGSGESLSRTVADALADPGRRLVAAVVNTIDDALDRSDPASTEWTRDTVRLVAHLLDLAGDRVVLLVSDHGHVVDRGAEATVRSYPDAAAGRWRPATAPAGEGEIGVSGRRVLLGDGALVLPWRESLRYGPRKAGYHGGASPAEAVIPLTVLTRGDESAVPGWSAAPVTSPAWWRGPVEVAPIQVAPPAPETPAQEAAESAGAGTLFDVVTAAPTAGPADRREPAAASPRPALVAALLGAPQYQRNRQLKLAGQPTLPDDRVAALLTGLLAAGGRQRMDALAARAGVPAQRIANTVTVLRRLLSVEGYQSVTVDSDGQTVVLDERMLRDQFGLGVGG